jgi:CheY-like chemotaxis protein
VRWFQSICRILRAPDGKAQRAVGVNIDMTDIVTARRAAEEATQFEVDVPRQHEPRDPHADERDHRHVAPGAEDRARAASSATTCSKIHNAGTSLLGIINDILDFSKIEAGKLDMEALDFSLDEYWRTSRRSSARRSHDKGLEFLSDVAPPAAGSAGRPAAPRADPRQPGQQRGQVHRARRNRCACELSSGRREGQARVRVRDSGIGMTQEQCGKLFQAFPGRRLDDAQVRRHRPGTHDLQALVEMMGGMIWVESEPGRGSNFQFTAWFGLSAKRHARRRVVPESLNGLRVLVVDDSAAAREVILDALADKPFEMRAAHSGEEAVAEVEAADAAGKPVDLVFMDWRMPGMGGAEAAVRIKKHKTLSRTPRVVMVTAFGRDEVREEAGRAHLDGFLVKPVSASMLVDTVIDLFGEDEAGVLPVAADARKSWGLRGVRVLLAEDNEINQQIAIELLESEGVAVDVARNGREALDKVLGAAEGAYDAVLMDLQMPEMGGIEATERIRQHRRFETLPIIAMTAHAMAEERQKCMDAGMQDHVTKPIDPDALYRTLAAWCKPAAHAKQAAPARAEIKHDAEPIPQVEGLDTAGGMKRVAGNQRLYLKLLRQYLEGQSGATNAIRTSLGSGDRKTAERIAHTAKGVSGNIGADAVQAVAGELEHAIATGSETEPLIAAFDAALGVMLGRLSDALGAQPAETSALTHRVDAETLKPVLEQLAALLAASDGEALELLSAEEAVLKPALGSGYRDFERAINDFDFDSALERLKDTAVRHSIIL